MPIFIKDISKSFGATKVLDGFSMQIPDKGTVSILGRSGVGKTTVLNLIARIQLPDSGTILGLDEKKVSVVFQDERLIPWDSAIENVLAVLDDSLKNKTEVANTWLKKVGLEEKVYAKKPNQLSGGMKQRLTIARAFAFDADILVLDEPLKALDVKSKKSMMDLIKKQTEDKLVVMVTHSISEAVLMSDKIYILKGAPARLIKEIDVTLTDKQRETTSNEFKNYHQIISSLI